MKTFSKNILAFAVTALAFIGVPAFAQGNFDYFASPKTVQVSAPQILTQSSSTTLNVTNSINIAPFLGTVCMDIYSVSNSSAVAAPCTNQFTLLTSLTGTNGWTVITNAFFATSYSRIYTNYWGTTNSQYTTWTNVYQIPGSTVSNLNPGIALYSGQYVVPPAFANATASSTGSTVWTVGFDADNAGNYLAIAWQLNGTSAVYSVSATLRGRTKSGQY